MGVFAVASLLDQRSAQARLLRERLATVQEAAARQPSEELALVRDEMLSKIPAIDNLLRRSSRGMDGEIIGLQDIFVFDRTGIDESGKVKGFSAPLGPAPDLELAAIPRTGQPENTSGQHPDALCVQWSGIGCHWFLDGILSAAEPRPYCSVPLAWFSADSFPTRTPRIAAPNVFRNSRNYFRRPSTPWPEPCALATLLPPRWS
jgi:hypothetical protein